VNFNLFSAAFASVVLCACVSLLYQLPAYEELLVQVFKFPDSLLFTQPTLFLETKSSTHLSNESYQVYQDGITLLYVSFAGFNTPLSASICVARLDLITEGEAPVSIRFPKSAACCCHCVEEP
jgi:hypothetical protein